MFRIISAGLGFFLNCPAGGDAELAPVNDREKLVESAELSPVLTLERGRLEAEGDRDNIVGGGSASAVRGLAFGGGVSPHEYEFVPGSPVHVIPSSDACEPA